MANTPQRIDKRFETRSPQGVSSISARTNPATFESILLSTIRSTSNDPPDVRNLIYEIARLNVNASTEPGEPELSVAEQAQREFALEAAIARVEVECVGQERIRSSRQSSKSSSVLINPSAKIEAESPAIRQVPARDSSAGTNLTPITRRNARIRTEPPVIRQVSARDSAADIGPPPIVRRQAEPPRQELIPMRTEPTAPLRTARVRRLHSSRPEPSETSLATQPSKSQIEIVYAERESPAAERMRRRVWLWFVVWPFVQLAGPAIFSLLLFIAISGRLDVRNIQSSQVAEPRSQPLLLNEGPARAAQPLLPLPSSYGVYAISNGVLSELEALPMRAPDARIALSAEVKEPSRTVLPSGNIMFVVFRRELLNSAPQSVAVRVVARVEHDTRIVGGKAASTEVKGSWRIRSNSFEFKVSPFTDNREMIAVRPAAEDFVLPAGRYVLVLGPLAYDFTVAGVITDKSQCLESFEGVSGSIFSECRQK